MAAQRRLLEDVSQVRRVAIVIVMLEAKRVPGFANGWIRGIPSQDSEAEATAKEHRECFVRYFIFWQSIFVYWIDLVAVADPPSTSCPFALGYTSLSRMVWRNPVPIEIHGIVDVSTLAYFVNLKNEGCLRCESVDVETVHSA